MKSSNTFFINIFCWYPNMYIKLFFKVLSHFLFNLFYLNIYNIANLSCVNFGIFICNLDGMPLFLLNVLNSLFPIILICFMFVIHQSSAYPLLVHVIHLSSAYHKPQFVAPPSSAPQPMFNSHLKFHHQHLSQPLYFLFTMVFNNIHIITFQYFIKYLYNILCFLIYLCLISFLILDWFTSLIHTIQTLMSFRINSTKFKSYYIFPR